MTKSTPSGVERDMKSSLDSFKESAVAVKNAHRAARQEILDDVMASDFAKRGRVTELDVETRGKLDAIRAQQESYVRGVRDRLEQELLGDQPTDASSVLLRRDAADRTRRLADEGEAMAVLRDAVRGGDATLAHSVGHRARQAGWVDVLDAYREAHPQSADSAVALAFVEGLASDPGQNLANNITYSAP